MCGIVAALPDYSSAPMDVSAEELLDVLPDRPAREQTAGSDSPEAVAATLDGLVKSLGMAHERYSLVTACAQLAAAPAVRAAAGRRVSALENWLVELDGELDRSAASWDPDLLEDAQRLAVRARDLIWTIGHDRIDAAARVAALARDGIADLRVARAYRALDAVLDAVDRLEVRGRDSAGVQVWITLDDADAGRLPASLRERADADYRSTAVEFFRGGLSFVYKRASVIGRLGDNVAHLRSAITADGDLHAVLALPSARASVLAHTRWASVGRISEANAHPVNSVVPGAVAGRYASAALNGDIDNHVALREQQGVPSDPAGVSTDAKLIPVMLARQAPGRGPARALADSVRAYDGSFAIAAQADGAPEKLLLAVKGSGQALYVGFLPDCFLVASEVYGLVGWTSRYLRVDGTSGTGTVVVLDRAGAGTLDAVNRYDMHGQARPVTAAELSEAEITTRDVARGDFSHYVQKEISEAPSSFRKSLRGRIIRSGERLEVSIGEASLPQSLRQRFAAGDIRELVFVGQGTAAVACRGIASLVRRLLDRSLTVRAMPASELSAWELRPDMSSVCVVAVSQSGTTTDTNRTVDMARARGAAVLCVVNRRDSDLTHKSDGVLYTSDGRDVEMAVASTKAFYSQVATGALLGLQISRVCGQLPPDVEDSLLRALLEMPQQLAALHERSAAIAEVAQVATGYPYWTVVGSGPNSIAAEEIRIKLSELCYKTISTDAVEDKKHVDLSAEALVLVCAAGAPPGQIRDLAKEVEIFAAHRNAPVLIIDDGIDLPWATDRVIKVPAAHPALAWILSTAAGHLFAYHAARAIDGVAEPLRAALAGLETAVDTGLSSLGDLDQACDDVHQFLAQAAQGAARGVLPSDRALGLLHAAMLLRGDAGLIPMVPVEAGATDPVDFVRKQLTNAVDELTRSIDSVKHQAKTVTVGTSRGDSDLLDNELTAAVTQAGGDPAMLGYSVLLVLRAFSRCVAGITGTTRYQIGSSDGQTWLCVTRKTGIACDLASRADQRAELSGSKALVVQSRAVRLVRGLRDNRLVLIIPERTGAQVRALTIAHVELCEKVEPAHLTELLDLTGNRLAEIKAAVTELDTPFDPTALAALDVETALLAPVEQVALSTASKTPVAGS